MRLALPCLLLVASLAACAPTEPEVVFEPSRKSAVELRAMQVRQVPGDADTVMRGVIATLHDLGYRITKAEPDAGTISATRATALRMAVVVQPRTPELAVVRANATIVAPLREAQVDSPEFYARNFFEPLAAMMHREVTAVPDEAAAPEAARPAAELNTARARAAAAARAGGATSGQTPATQTPATGSPR